MRERHRRMIQGMSIALAVGLAVLLFLAPATSVRADPGGIEVYIKDGKPTELTADGKSRTTLVVKIVDQSHSCWGGPISGEGQYALLVGNSIATVAPNNEVDIQFPAELIVTAGTESGTAEIKMQASWCPKEAIGIFGVCTDPKRGMSKCEAEILISIGDAPAPPADPAKPPDNKESEEFGVTVACAAKKPEGDKTQEGKLEEGKPLVCTATVKGVRPKETFQYTWYVDGTEMGTTTAPTWTWDKAAAGYHEVGLDIVSQVDSRSERGDTSIDIPAAAQPAQPPAQPAQPAQPPAQPAQPPSQPAQPAQPAKPPSQYLPPSSGGGDLPIPSADKAINITTFDLLSKTLTDIAVERGARDPSTPAKGMAAGAVAVETIALVLANLGATGRLAKGTAQPKQGAGRGAPAAKKGAAAPRGQAGSMAQSRQQLGEVVQRVPPVLRDSERWKTRVAPLLERAKKWTDQAKVDRLRKKIEWVSRRRRNVEKHPRASKLEEMRKEKLAWTVRGREIFPSRFGQSQAQKIVQPAKLKVQTLSAPREPDDIDKLRRRTNETIDRLRGQVHKKARAFMGRGRDSQPVPNGVLDPHKFPLSPSKPPRESRSWRYLRQAREALRRLRDKRWGR